MIDIKLLSSKNSEPIVITIGSDVKATTDFINIELRLPSGEYCGLMELNTCLDEKMLNDIIKGLINSCHIKSNSNRIAKWNKELDRYEMQ